MNNISINSALEPLQVLVDSGKLIEAKAWMQANKDTFDPVMYDFNMGNILLVSMLMRVFTLKIPLKMGFIRQKQLSYWQQLEKI